MTSISRGLFLTVLCMASVPEARAVDIPVSDAAAFREVNESRGNPARGICWRGQIPWRLYFNSVAARQSSDRDRRGRSGKSRPFEMARAGFSSAIPSTCDWKTWSSVK